MELTEDFREGVIKVGRQALEKTVQDAEPFMPKMLVDIDGELTVMAYPASFEGLEMIAGFLIAQSKPVKGICLTADTYHYIAPEGEGIEDAGQYAGRLEALFNSGHPQVCEALHLTLVTEDRLISVTIPYKRIGRGKVEWRPEIILDADEAGMSASGRFPKLLQAIIAATNMEGNGDA